MATMAPSWLSLAATAFSFSARQVCFTRATSRVRRKPSEAIFSFMELAPDQERTP